MRTFASDELTEIRDSYRNAADQKKQIGILADLHDCTVQDIQRALGLPVTSTKSKPSTGRRQKRAYVQWQKDQVAQLCELYEKGYKLVDIADMLGIPLERVKKKVFTMGTAGQLTLRSHRQKSKPQKVPPEQNRQKEQRETQLVTASGAEERSSDVHVLLQDYFSRIGELSTADDCNFPSVPHALFELDQLLTRAAALVYALRVLAEKGGGA
ncbi:hypothetical protein [uncultured Agathobaculum sp.]|uniref:hypothetical protein n=1 Tax=uncultured Agathobaculum sp. TaxID=2048140 RepID=UPI00320B7BB1